MGRFLDALNRLPAIVEDVETFETTLRELQSELENRDLKTSQRTVILRAAQTSDQLLQELKARLNKHHGLLVVSPGLESRGRIILRKIWKIVNWDGKGMEELEELRTRITSHISLLSGLTTMASIDQLLHRQMIVDWLTNLDFASDLRNLCASREEHTGVWIFDATNFKQWTQGKGNILFCPGIPGAGKSIIAAMIVDRLRTILGQGTGVGVACLFCSFAERGQKLEDFAASILKQFVQKLHPLPDSVERLWHIHREGGTRPSLEEISQTLPTVVEKYPQAFVVIDGLDEFPEAYGCQRELISWIFNLHRSSGINVLVTSRYIPQIMEAFRNHPTLEIRARDEDIDLYIKSYYRKLPSFIDNSNLGQGIREKILQTADGMFLFAHISLNYLASKKTPKAIYRALPDLPSVLVASDRPYRDTMHRIQMETHDTRELAQRVLSWITYAKRPLTTAELQDALAVETDETEFDPESIPQVEDMISVCAGLVTVDENKVVRFIHDTTRLFFEKFGVSLFPGALAHIAAVCRIYISFVKAGSCAGDERLRQYPFYDYASQNCQFHVAAASTDQKKAPSTTLDDESTASGSGCEIAASKKREGRSQGTSEYRDWARSPMPQSLNSDTRKGITESWRIAQASGKLDPPSPVPPDTQHFNTADSLQSPSGLHQTLSRVAPDRSKESDVFDQTIDVRASTELSRLQGLETLTEAGSNAALDAREKVSIGSTATAGVVGVGALVIANKSANAVVESANAATRSAQANERSATAAEKKLRLDMLEARWKKKRTTRAPQNPRQERPDSTASQSSLGPTRAPPNNGQECPDSTASQPPLRPTYSQPPREDRQLLGRLEKLRKSFEVDTHDPPGLRNEVGMSSKAKGKALDVSPTRNTTTVQPDKHTEPGLSRHDPGAASPAAVSVRESDNDRDPELAMDSDAVKLKDYTPKIPRGSTTHDTSQSAAQEPLEAPVTPKVKTGSVDEDSEDCPSIMGGSRELEADHDLTGQLEESKALGGASDNQENNGLKS